MWKSYAFRFVPCSYSAGTVAQSLEALLVRLQLDTIACLIIIIIIILLRIIIMKTGLFLDALLLLFRSI